MRRRKLKSFVIPTIISVLIIVLVFTAVLVTNTMKKKVSPEDTPVLAYVTSSILNNDVAVINTTTKMINPYTDQSVTIGKTYYDYQADTETQQKSIIYHDDTYMQNSGMDFVSANVFDVVAVLEGTVNDVKEDETLGKIVEIKHNNEYISIYQSLSEVSVKKGDTVTQGQVLGKSGTNELDKEIGNHLHFELYINGQIVNPSLYLNKEISNTKAKE